MLEKSLAIHYLNECSGSFCFHLSCNGGICLILGERQRAETVENLHKIFVDKISQKKYNEIELYEICKKTGYMDNYCNFVYPICPEPIRFREIQNPADLKFSGTRLYFQTCFKTAGDGWERR